MDNDIDLTNSGTISSNADNITILSGSIATSRIVNTGLISSVFGDAVNGANSVQLLTNFGEIFGTVNLAGGADIIDNTRTITGDVIFSAGFNTVNNAGIIQGRVSFGENGDVYLASGDGYVSEEVDGGAGSDLMRGAAQADALNGDAGNDTLSGQGGGDTLNGQGDDDILRGGSDDDALNGGEGFDRLFGDNGDVFIFGGLDRDVLFGGNGADTFIYNSVLDSTNAATDGIRDFKSGQDTVDLSKTTGLEMIFNDTSGFLGGGTASVFYNVSASDQAILRVDVDGDGVQDIKVKLFNVTEMTAGDFLL